MALLSQEVTSAVVGLIAFVLSRQKLLQSFLAASAKVAASKSVQPFVFTSAATLATAATTGRAEKLLLPEQSERSLEADPNFASCAGLTLRHFLPRTAPTLQSAALHGTGPLAALHSAALPCAVTRGDFYTRKTSSKIHPPSLLTFISPSPFFHIFLSSFEVGISVKRKAGKHFFR